MGPALSKGNTATGITTIRTSSRCSKQFWRDGIRRNKNYESIITIGLRAENDSGMPIGKDLTEQIVGVQRNILAEEMNPDPTKVPQLWCLYKEVQDFYNAGMRVPDDVTLLWADDNWGNIRRLPTADRTPAQRRRGNLLSLRLPRRTAQLPVDQHQPDFRRSGTRCRWRSNMAPTASGL